MADTEGFWEQHHGFDEDDCEQKEACLTIIECPHCTKPVELIAESEAWEQGEDGRWYHAEYGPPVGECCGVLFLDDPLTGNIRTMRLEPPSVSRQEIKDELAL